MKLKDLTDKQLEDIIRTYPSTEEFIMIQIQGIRAKMEIELRSLAKAIEFKRDKKGNWIRQK